MKKDYRPTHGVRMPGHPLFGYTINTIRRNRYTSLSVMLAVTLASTLLCAMCTYGYTQIKWQAEVEEYEAETGTGSLAGILPRISCLWWRTI